MCGLHAHHTGGRRESPAGHVLGSRVPVGAAEPESESEHCFAVAVPEQPGADRRRAQDDHSGSQAEDHGAEHPFRRAGR
jgi:hypothetical protein